MNCPSCDVPLSRVKYENVSVSQCPQCMGYLVNRNRVILIKTTQEISSAALQAEATSQSHPDSQSIIRCPKCRSRTMRKERIPVKTDNDFSLDVCRDCNVAWFDGGELARLQIQYESSMKAIEAYAFQQKLQNQTEEEKEEFQRNLAALPKRQGWLHSIFQESLLGTITVVLVLLTPLMMIPNLMGLNFPTWVPAVTSLGCALSLIRLCVRMIDGGRGRLTALFVVIAMEVLFLSFLFY